MACNPNRAPAGAVGAFRTRDPKHRETPLWVLSRNPDWPIHNTQFPSHAGVGVDGRDVYLVPDAWEWCPLEAARNPFAERGAAIEALGKAMQDGNSTVARLVELADAAGLRLAFRVDGE